MGCTWPAGTDTCPKQRLPGQAGVAPGIVGGDERSTPRTMWVRAESTCSRRGPRPATHKCAGGWRPRTGDLKRPRSPPPAGDADQQLAGARLEASGFIEMRIK